MSFIYCPECGTSISDRALVCPSCGFIGRNKKLPISKQNEKYLLPIIQVDFEVWNPNSKLPSLTYIENQNVMQYLSSFSTISKMMPTLAVAIKELSKGKQFLVNIDAFTSKLINSGVLRLMQSEGQLLPTLVDGKTGKIIKQLKLTEMSPQVTSTLKDLGTQLLIAQVINELKYVGTEINSIKVGMQNDRLALLDSAKEKLEQALLIRDRSLQRIAILNAINTATDAKNKLMKEYEREYAETQGKGPFSIIKILGNFTLGNKTDKNTMQLLNNLVSITNTVQIEVEGYKLIGEKQALNKSLLEFKSFILRNDLVKDEDINNVTKLECIANKVKENEMHIVEEFTLIVNNIVKINENISNNKFLEIANSNNSYIK